MSIASIVGQLSLFRCVCLGEDALAASSDAVQDTADGIEVAGDPADQRSRSIV